MPRELSAFEGHHEAEKVRAGSDRSFGRVFAAVFALIGLWPLLHAQMPRWWAFAVALAFFVVSAAAPQWLAPFNRAWFLLGKALHAVVSPVVMGAIFFVVVTPIALLRRMSGRDLLGLRFSRQAQSYWVLRKPPGPEPETLKQQF
jgi:hypothetical protein